MKQLAGFILLLIFISSCHYEFEGQYDGVPFEMERIFRPSIPSNCVSITDYGAISDGHTVCTDAFEEAIANLSVIGGGRVVVPAGLWITGPVELQSHVDIHLEKGAVISFSDDSSLYPVIDANFEGVDTRRCISPFYAKNKTDIAITGEGLIDGNGDGWRMLRKTSLGSVEWENHLAKHPKGVFSDDGIIWYPDEAFKKARSMPGRYQNTLLESVDETEFRRWFRPNLVYFENCRNILLEGCTFQNSPSWNIHPVFCENIIIKDITVRSPYSSMNGDGLDIDACTNVLLLNSTFDVGDDAICIKSGRGEDGWKHNTPCSKILIRNCTVYHGHGGFTVGSEMSGGVRDVFLSGCTFIGTDVGFRFKSTRGRGGVVENIWLQDTNMKDIITFAILFNMYYASAAATQMSETLPEEAPVQADETTPVFRNIHISNVVCSGCERAMYFRGLPEKPITGVKLKDITINARKESVFLYCDNPEVENVNVVYEAH